MRSRNLLRGYAVLVLTILLLAACSGPEDTAHSLLIPVGRSAVVGGNSYQVLVDAEPYDPELIYDRHGGYWIEVFYDPEENAEVVLRVSIEREQPGLYHEESPDRQRWLAPSRLIDSDDPALVAQAQKLTTNSQTAVEKARSIQRFVIDHLHLRVYMGHFLNRASATYEMGYGTCVNHARLFVALSRAAGLPARTVWGIIYTNGLYDYHHEWAEFLDEDGYWHPLDFTFTTAFDLSDVRYLDLIYASEENPLYARSARDRYQTSKSQFIVYDTSKPAYDGRLGFRLAPHSSPTSPVVENVYVLADLPRLVPQRSP